jgi:hypothetical protein
MDLQAVLYKLSNELEAKHQFRKANLVGETCICESTQPIASFLIWLKNTPQAKQVLESMNIYIG